MVDNWNRSSSSTAVLESAEPEATDNDNLDWDDDHDSDRTTDPWSPHAPDQFPDRALDQTQIGDATKPTGFASPKNKMPARSQFAAEYTAPSESDTGTCDGEIIEVLDSRVVCWLKISDKLRVRSVLDESLFDNLPKYPGAQFCWSADSGAVSPMEFDNADLIAECDRLEREWDEDLKHRTPRMAD